MYDRLVTFRPDVFRGFAGIGAYGEETASPFAPRFRNLVAKFRTFQDDSGRERIDRESSACRGERTGDDSE
jgi:hypothetical protein